jgi:hypothetical protein
MTGSLTDTVSSADVEKEFSKRLNKGITFFYVNSNGAKETKTGTLKSYDMNTKTFVALLQGVSTTYDMNQVTGFQ